MYSEQNHELLHCDTIQASVTLSVLSNYCAVVNSLAWDLINSPGHHFLSSPAATFL